MFIVGLTPDTQILSLGEKEYSFEKAGLKFCTLSIVLTLKTHKVTKAISISVVV